MRGVLILKIYIVQKGDTFQKIAQEYDVDMNVLIRVNPQIAKPEMILPGMKMKVPQKRKQVTNNQHTSLKLQRNDFPKEMHQLPVIEEDDIWENTLSGMFTTAVKPETKQHITSDKQHHQPTKNNAFQSIRHNPISKIRNMPNDNFPEISFMQVIP